MNVNEVSFIDHCDEPVCCLGRIQFKCPGCNWTNDNFDDWFDRDRASYSPGLETKCLHCKVDLVLFGTYEGGNQVRLATDKVCSGCGEVKLPELCKGNDQCVYGENGGPDQVCSGWTVYCHRCGSDYARDQI
jgi:hypothetical protein